jgi:hypothetical protein
MPGAPGVGGVPRALSWPTTDADARPTGTATVMTTMGMTTAQAVTASNRISVRSMGAVPSVTLFTGSSQHTRTSVIEEALDGTFGTAADRSSPTWLSAATSANRDNGPVHTSLPSPAHMRRMPQARPELGR